jgi:hypothetical protein
MTGARAHRNYRQIVSERVCVCNLFVCLTWVGPLWLPTTLIWTSFANTALYHRPINLHDNPYQWRPSSLSTMDRAELPMVTMHSHLSRLPDESGLRECVCERDKCCKLNCEKLISLLPSRERTKSNGGPWSLSWCRHSHESEQQRAQEEEIAIRNLHTMNNFTVERNKNEDESTPHYDVCCCLQEMDVK